MNNLSHNKNNTCSKGFSLIELLIAVSMFLIITVAAIGSMVHLQGAARRGEAVYATLDNLNLAVDSMARLMRTGYTYHCDVGFGTLTPLSTRDCAYNLTDGGTSFAFYDQTGTLIQYKLAFTPTTPPVGYITMQVGNTGTPLRITDNNIDITRFRVYVQGSSNADTLQPYAVIVLAGQIKLLGKPPSSFNIETSMTQRLPDIAP
jgi:prepilin-type N-terminal cleavage/methylation domain-containing protein